MCSCFTICFMWHLLRDLTLRSINLNLKIRCWWGVTPTPHQHCVIAWCLLGESHVHSERIVRAYQCTVDTCIHTVTIKDVYTAHLMKTPHHVIHTTILSSSFNTAPTFSNDGPFANSAEAWFPIEYIYIYIYRYIVHQGSNQWRIQNRTKGGGGARGRFFW